MKKEALSQDVMRVTLDQRLDARARFERDCTRARSPSHPNL